MELKQHTDSGSDDSSCSPSSETPETDARTRHSWMWDTRKMDYRPAGIVVDVDLARKLERERNAFRDALKQIRSNPGWIDDEVGFMSGHIAAGVLNQFAENAESIHPESKP